MNDPHWTDKIPTEPGWYWWCVQPSQKPRAIIRAVRAWPGGGLCVHAPEVSDHRDGMTTPEQVGGWWFGPIIPPA